MPATAEITVKSSVKKALITGTMAVCIATTGSSFVSQYISKPVIAKVKELNTTSSFINKRVHFVSNIKKNSIAYTEAKPYSKRLLSNTVNKEEEIGVDNMGFHNPTSETVPFPVQYKGKLQVARENNFSFNNDREKIDMSHKVEKISMPVSYGGRLPIGRERI